VTERQARLLALCQDEEELFGSRYPAGHVPGQVKAAAAPRDEHAVVGAMKSERKRASGESKIKGLDETKRKRDFSDRTKNWAKSQGYTHYEKVERWNPFLRGGLGGMQDMYGFDWLAFGPAGICLIQVTSVSNAASHRKSLAAFPKAIQAWKAGGGRAVLLLFGGPHDKARVEEL